MLADQAIYTSMRRGGRDGYHVVARSPGVSEADAAALASWSPSHGTLLVDEANRVSVNFHPLTDGRVALSRTCEGPPEYSGRGGPQIYTHALVLEAAALERSGASPVALYRGALALGLLGYRPDPPPTLGEVELGRCFRGPGRDQRADQAPELDLPELEGLCARLGAGEQVRLRHHGDRLRFAERLLGVLPGQLAAAITFSTSLQPSSSRPFKIVIVA